MKFPVAATLRFTFRALSTFAAHHRRSVAFTLATAAAVLAVAGCGGLGANTASNNPPSPTPTPLGESPGPSPTPTPATASTVNIPTWHMDNGRSGLNSQETVLTPANVSASTFGKLFSYHVDGYSYAQPLYISNLRINGASHNVVFVATEMASVYAFDADNFGDGSPLWKTSLLQPGDVPQPGGNPKPAQGLTSTPVIDTGSNAMYVVTAQKSSTGAFSFRLHAIDITTGLEHANSPVTIHASVAGTNSEAVNGVITLNNSCLQRAALLLSHGTLYIGFSACPTGWLLSYDAASLNQIAVLNMSPNMDGYGQFGGAGGVWMGGGGPAGDDQGDVYLSTGNGFYDGATEWGDSILKVDSQLHINDHFTPFDWSFLQCRDLDVSAGGIMLVPGQSQLLGGGKAGKMYLVNTGNMGQVQPNDAGAAQTLFFSPGATSQTCVTNTGQTVTGDKGTTSFYGTAAWFNGSLFVGNDPGPVKQFTLTSGHLTAAASSAETISTFSYGTTPFISANGTSAGIVWVLDHGQPVQDPIASSPAPAILRAYDATNIAHLLYSSAQNAADVPGFGIKFTEPIVANGKVFITTAHDSLSAASPQGELDVYGLK
jgi:hypothetical protein